MRPNPEDRMIEFRPYRRLPALAVLALAAVAGLVYLRTWGQASGGPAGTEKELEQAILREGDKASAQLWRDYAVRLREAGKHQAAADAFRQVLERKVEDRERHLEEARFGLGLALAEARNGDALYKYVEELIAAGAPKVAQNVLERPESAPLLKEPRFAGLLSDVRAAVLD